MRLTLRHESNGLKTARTRPHPARSKASVFFRFLPTLRIFGTALAARHNPNAVQKFTEKPHYVRITKTLLIGKSPTPEFSGY